MSWLWWTILLVAGVAALELGLKALVQSLRSEFQWLTTKADIAPKMDEALVEKYISGSFDPDLGWVRKPGTGGVDQTENGPAAFTVDKHGARMSPGPENIQPSVAVFGDSYAFCRLVTDEQTWPHQLGQLLKKKTVNFGVGNYGLDQACIRMERELARASYDVVVMCVVPETMSRIHSYWKHYFEYGNILAFKPRYTLEGERLVHHGPAVSKPEDFQTYQQRLKEIQNLDGFYRSKFHKDILCFPYSWKLIRRWWRHIPIIWHLILGRATGQRDAAAKRAFDVVLRNNARETARLYASEAARLLLSGLARNFMKIARSANAEPMLVIVPQPVDLQRRWNGNNDYGEFFEQLAKDIPVIDMTEKFLAAPDAKGLYVEGDLGPHVNEHGNHIIAQAVAEKVRPIFNSAVDRQVGAGGGVLGMNSCA